MRFKRKTEEVEATQWFKNGDHPLDDVMRPFEDTGQIPSEPREGKVVRYFRRPDVSGASICPKCGRIMHEHGWIDAVSIANALGVTVMNEHGVVYPNDSDFDVCPGDFVLTTVNGIHYPMPRSMFVERYECEVVRKLWINPQNHPTMPIAG